VKKHSRNFAKPTHVYAYASSDFKDEKMRRSYDIYGPKAVQGSTLQAESEALSKQLRNQMYSTMMAHLDDILGK
jgi:hypothetical protein